MSSDHVREHIEIAIDRARERVGERIDELDDRLRGKLDVNAMAGDHAPQLLVAGATLGLLLGLGVPKVLLRSIQLGVPLWLAVRIVKSRAKADRFPSEGTAVVPAPDEAPVHGDPLI